MVAKGTIKVPGFATKYVLGVPQAVASLVSVDTKYVQDRCTVCAGMQPAAAT